MRLVGLSALAAAEVAVVAADAAWALPVLVGLQTTRLLSLLLLDHPSNACNAVRFNGGGKQPVASVCLGSRLAMSALSAHLLFVAVGQVPGPVWLVV